MKKSVIERIQKSERIEIDIVFATLPLIQKEGYESVTIREICENAHVTTGMFYRHFASKDAVLIRCFELQFEEQISEIDARIKEYPLSEQILILLTEVLKIHQSFGSDSIKAFFNRDIESKCKCLIEEKISAIINRAVAAGVALLNGNNAEQICADICVLLNGLIIEWYMSKQEDLISYAVDVLKRIIPKLL